MQRPAERRLCVVCERGKLEWSLTGRYFKRFAADGELLEFDDFSEFSRNALFERELVHFLSCIERGEAPNVSLREGAESLAVALCLLDSQASGQPVALRDALESAGLGEPGASK